MITAPELARFRRRIGDQPKADTDALTLETAERVVELRFSNVYDVVVSKDGLEVPTADYEIDAVTGTVTFDTAQAAGSKLRFEYRHVAYSDEEISNVDGTGLVDIYGFERAVLEVVEELLMDAARMYDYSEGATTEKLSQLFDHLMKMKEGLLASGAASPAGANGVSVVRRIADPYKTQPRVQTDLSRLEGN